MRLLSVKMGDYIAKMSAVWVEGQIVQLNRRGDAQYCYLTLRDADTDVSLPVSMPVPASASTRPPVMVRCHPTASACR